GERGRAGPVRRTSAGGVAGGADRRGLPRADDRRVCGPERARYRAAEACAVTSPGVQAAKLRKVFEQELQRGCSNDLVIGGLDRMLIQMDEDGLLTRVPTLRERVDRLPAGGYRTLPVPERKDWLR